LLLLSKPRDVQYQLVDLNHVLDDIMPIVRSEALLHGIEVVEHLDGKLPMVIGDSELLKQVFLNICKNGIEAMKDGGTLTLRVYKDSRYGIFEVRDTGVGMTKEELKQLGMPYFTRKEKGTGIGLTVCWQIISRMNGKIEVESEKGKGTVFRIKVPLEKGEVSGS
ncbi:MAG: PAS domain-containing sensor histidine kinase, partial [Bacillales bacterium]